jgi:hypothetical protein
MSAPELRNREQALVSHASRLRLDVAAATLLRTLEEAGIGALLLKGASIAQWLYTADAPRVYLDCDLLVAPYDFEKTEQIASALGYTCAFDDSTLPSWWRENSRAWVRDSDEVTVDLHRCLPGVGIEPEAAWLVLARSAVRVTVGGDDVPALGLPARALHVALHAAHHGVARARPIEDLDRALTQCDERLWRTVADLAGELKAVDPLAAGLRLSWRGAELAGRLQLPADGSVETRLRASSPPPVALGIEQLAQAENLRARLEILVLKLFPPPAFIRHWDPVGSDTRLGMLRSCLRRPFWLMRRAPAGIRAWNNARRSVKGDQRTARH